MRHVSFALAWCVAAAVATAAPPVLSESEVKAVVGKPALLTVKVEAGKKLGTEKTFDPKALMVARLWSDDPTTFEFWIIPNEAGTFYLPFWTEGETRGVTLKVVAGSGAKPDDPVKPDPPKPDKPAPAEVYYFAVIGAAGPVLPSVATSLKLPAWDELRKAGHVVNYVPVNELSDGLPRPGMTPVVMVLKRDGSKWVDTGSNKPLPTTDEQIRSLIK